MKAELAIDGIDYNIVRSDTFKPSEKSFDLLEATAALACATGEASYAVQAKREIGKFYEDLTKGLYKGYLIQVLLGYTFITLSKL